MRRKAALCGEVYSWVPDLRSLEKLREVGDSPYFGFTLCLRAMLMFELIEVVSGFFDRSQNLGLKCENFFEPSLCSPWGLGAVWASLVMFYAINDALMCMRPEMTVKFGFTK